MNHMRILRYEYIAGSALVEMGCEKQNAADSAMGYAGTK